MKKYKWFLILINLIILLLYFNYSVYQKEKTLDNGKLMLLKLAPVDPRSLMQGDYMSLRYDINDNDINTDKVKKRGFCVVTIDKNNVAQLVRLQNKETPLNKNEFLIKYTLANGFLNIGAESFFFQEGHGEKYEAGKYGALKVDENGNSILIGLYNENFKEIK